MCPKIKILKFRKEAGRYTEKLYNILSDFLKTGKLNYQFKSINENLKRNIVYTNQKRQEILERLCTSGNTINFYYQRKNETYKICNGLLVQCIKNIKKRNMYNNEEYTIHKIEGENITLNNGQVFHSKEFSFSFLPLLACTTHKYQGGSINENYNIYEADKMNRNMLYTALSRATHEDYIHIDNIKGYYEQAEYLKETFLIKPCQDEKYNKGKIYLITAGDNYYIGETTLDLETRLEQHLNDIESPIYNLKHLKPEIKLIVKFPCFSHKELMKCEEKYIKIYKQMYGDKCLNKKQLETKTIKNEIKVDIKKYLRTDKFKIVDDEKRSCFRLKYTMNGIVKDHTIRYGKRTDKETALERMEAKKKEICDFFDW
jgi:predicted GIY-YIG superfamily endonuclease